MSDFASMITGSSQNAMAQMQSARAASAAAMAGRAQALGAAQNSAAIDKTARDFTSVFMSQMLAPMFEGLETDETFGGGHGEEMMRGLMLQEMGKQMAKVDNTGLTDAVKAEMIRLQGGASSKKTV